MSSVLVTGGSGFIGRPTLAALVERGEEVHALTRSPDPPPISGVRWHHAELGEDGAAERLIEDLRPERLVHLAWYVEHGKFWEAPENVQWVEHSLRLLRAFTASGGRRAVILGSCAEYAWADDGAALDELGSTIAPATLYGVAKDALRRLVAAYAERQDVEVAWGRLFFLYGPREDPRRLVASVARALLAGEPALTGSATQLRDFLHVDDVGLAVAELLASNVVGPVNIASGEAVELGAVLDLIVGACGGGELLRRGALPDRPGEPRVLLADVGRLRDEVGFRPRIGLEPGIAETVEWWRKHGADEPGPRS
jgi:nucleoside-diphosphate-sugar epimerase